MPRKILELPQPPQLPDRLPLEDQLSSLVDQVLNIADRDPILNAVNKVIDKIPVIPEKTYPTPLGVYKTPEFYIPKLKPAALDNRQREAFKAAVLQDVAELLQMIPTLGVATEPITDAIYDTAQAKIQDTLNPEENQYFKSYNKVDPLSTIAMIRTMVRTQKEL